MRRLLNVAEKIGFLNVLDHFQPLKANYLYILNYHRVDDANHRPWLNPNLISTSPQQFEQQMQLLVNRYHPVTLDDVLNVVAGKQILPNRAVLVTVDDGYIDFKEFIHPICNQLHIEPVLFVSTAFVGSGNFWWDKLYQLLFSSRLKEIQTPFGRFPLLTQKEKWNAYLAFANFIRSSPYLKAKAVLDKHYSLAGLEGTNHISTLGWDELRILAGQGVAIASHSHSHPLLSNIPIDKVDWEVETSQAILKREIGKSWPVMAYPDGKPESYNPQVIKAIQKYGIQLAFTTREGIAFLDQHDPLQLPRIGIWGKTNQTIFHYHLTSFYGIKTIY